MAMKYLASIPSAPWSSLVTEHAESFMIRNFFPYERENDICYILCFSMQIYDFSPYISKSSPKL